MGKIKYISTTKYSINGVEWELFLLSDTTYKNKMGKDSAAICFFKDKQVYFYKSEFTPRTIMHEILHCLVESHNLQSAHLSPSQFEEFMCELLSSYYYKLGLWSDEIYNLLKK
jgi:uncharacterized protein (DUF2164 family)